MFTLSDSRTGISRRDFLRVGSLGGLSLSHLLAAQAAAGSAKSVLTDKTVVFLFMQGGPSQFETFDPKMGAPDGIRSVNGEIATRLPGVTFGKTFPRLAALADKLAIVRSYRPGNATHDIKPIVDGETKGGASLGAFYARMAGMNHPDTGMPTNVLLYPQAVDPTTQPGTRGFGDLASTGGVGASFAPFVPGAGGTMQKNMELKLSPDRLDDRRGLLAQLDSVQRHLDGRGEMPALDRFQGQAFDVLLRGVGSAFDLSKEDSKTIQRYDTAPLVRPENIDNKWKNYVHYVDNAKSLGKLMLLTRRLCEAGCGFITLTTNFVWDMHADVNNAGVAEGMNYMGLPFDHAVSAFIEDLDVRGLSDKVLLVCCGEIGRSPRVNKAGGRDHWANLGPLLLSGGGLKMGRVVGASTPTGSDPVSDPITPRDLRSTIMHTLFDLGELRVVRGLPSEVAKVAFDGEPIKELVSY